jgi:hypothetical protein
MHGVSDVPGSLFCVSLECACRVRCRMSHTWLIEAALLSIASFVEEGHSQETVTILYVETRVFEWHVSVPLAVVHFSYSVPTLVCQNLNIRADVYVGNRAVRRQWRTGACSYSGSRVFVSWSKAQ